ncbi:MAG: RNA-directed DNA polymerase, partial [bacterium]|nr:RNA-directed DNA polymerase [bacterium]
MDAFPDHLKDLYERSIVGCTDEERSEGAWLLSDFRGTLAGSNDSPGRAIGYEHTVVLQPGKVPPRLGVRRFGPFHREVITRELARMEELGIVRRSNSPYETSPLVVVRKKDGSHRLCSDMRQLNSCLAPFAGTRVKNISDVLDSIGSHAFYASLDMLKGYWQISVSESSRPLLAFTAPNGIRYEYAVLVMGLADSASRLESILADCLQGLNWKICSIYLDDILVLGDSRTELLRNIRAILTRLRDVG